MEGMNSLLTGIGQILHIILNVYLWIIVIGALISWVNPDPFNPVVRFLRKATDPLFFWLRRHMPLVMGGVDISPVIAIALIVFIDNALVPSLVEQGNLVANILIGAGQSIILILNFYLTLVIIAAVVSFVNPSPYNPIVRILSAFTEPLFSWFRRRLPLVIGNIDLSPALIIVIILIINSLVSHTLIQMGLNLKMKGGL
jgi:YggT family protein